MKEDNKLQNAICFNYFLLKFNDDELKSHHLFFTVNSIC